MDNSMFYTQATEFARAAVEAESAKKWEEALSLYVKAIDRYQSGVKFEKDPTRREIVRVRAMEYADRADQIKKALDASKGAVVGGGGGGAVAARPTDGSGGAAGGDDGEAGKLKGALASAIVSEKPNVKWDDVAGLEGAKEALKEAVILPVRFPQLFVGKRKPWKGIMLYGPPGTGKSYLAKAVATEANATFFSVSSSDLVSKWQGESERLVRNLFELAREKKPSIVFIDEIDSLCGARGEGGETEGARRIKTEFLVQMQGVGKNDEGILVLAATNVPWEIDPAMRRRFEKRVYIPLPEPHAREKMFKIHLGDTPHDLRDADFKELGRITEGYSGSDISVVVREALMEPLRKCRTAKFFFRDPKTGMCQPVMADPPCPACTPDLASHPAPKNVPCSRCGCVRTTLYDLRSEELLVPPVGMEDFVHVMRSAKSSVASRELTKFEEWTKEFGSEGS